MKNDIKTRNAIRLRGRPKGPDTKKRTIDFAVYENEALEAWREERAINGKNPSYRTIIIDAMAQGEPRFKVILKQKQELYDKTKDRDEARRNKTAHAIEAEFGR